MGTSERVLVVAPTGADAANIGRVLRQAKLHVLIRPDANTAATKLLESGTLLVAEEALRLEHRASLVAVIEGQPPWSDVPVLIIASGASINRWATESLRLFGPRSNVSLIVRPLQAATLVAAVNAALRVRRRQYQLRDLLAEREALLGSLEQRVQERTAKLRELVAELESFSYSVSHDLRAPLRVMAGYAKVIVEEHGATLTPEVRHYVERIAFSSDKMDRLTQDVLTYTRLARGEIALELIDLTTAVKDLIEEYPELSAARDAIRLRAPLAPVIGHGPSLAQAISNLLGNAVKFARTGVPLKVEVFTETRKDRVRIVVKDNGRGIERAHQGKIFRIFERAVGAEIPGTGIGLAIVKKAAERMGGAVGVKSEPDQGSQFWIDLPKAPPQGRRAARGRAGTG
jgi:signal transduction histidine kinase